MIIYAGKDYYDVSRKAANIMSAQIIMKPRAVLGLATGSTPIGMYKQLIEWYKKGDLDFSQVTSVNLDEYKGLSGDNDQSYRYFMNTNLFDHVNIDKSRTYVPNGLEEDGEKACADYNEIIRNVGGVDMQLLGIGGNGHIGFNEPGEAFEKETHCVDLTESTIKANARFFASMDEVPSRRTRDSLHPSTMFRNRHIPWVSRTLWRQRRFCLWQPEVQRRMLFINLCMDRSLRMYRHLFCSFIQM